MSEHVQWHLVGRRRELLIQCEEIFFRQSDLERLAILHDVLGLCGFWNRDDATLPEDPRKRDLRWSGAVLPRDALQYRAPENSPIAQRASTPLSASLSPCTRAASRPQ